MRDDMTLRTIIRKSLDRGPGPHGGECKHLVELPLTDEEYAEFMYCASGVCRCCQHWAPQATDTEGYCFLFEKPTVATYGAACTAWEESE